MEELGLSAKTKRRVSEKTGKSESKFRLDWGLHVR